MEIEVEKNPGWDWNIAYQYWDETIEIMSVFGKMTMDDALTEARRSLSSGFESEYVEGVDFSIYGAVRIDCCSIAIIGK